MCGGDARSGGCGRTRGCRHGDANGRRVCATGRYGLARDAVRKGLSASPRHAPHGDAPTHTLWRDAYVCVVVVGGAVGNAAPVGFSSWATRPALTTASNDAERARSSANTASTQAALTFSSVEYLQAVSSATCYLVRGHTVATAALGQHILAQLQRAIDAIAASRPADVVGASVTVFARTCLLEDDLWEERARTLLQALGLALRAPPSVAISNRILLPCFIVLRRLCASAQPAPTDGWSYTTATPATLGPAFSGLSEPLTVDEVASWLRTAPALEQAKDAAATTITAAAPPTLDMAGSVGDWLAPLVMSLRSRELRGEAVGLIRYVPAVAASVSDLAILWRWWEPISPGRPSGERSSPLSAMTPCGWPGRRCVRAPLQSARNHGHGSAAFARASTTVGATSWHGGACRIGLARPRARPVIAAGRAHPARPIRFVGASLRVRTRFIIDRNETNRWCGVNGWEASGSAIRVST